MNVTPALFAQALLDRLHLPVTDNNVRALVAFQNQEGGHENGAHFNPLNTSLRIDGSVNFKTRKNEPGVQSYNSWEEGLGATAKTMAQGNMRSIVDALQKNSTPADTMTAIAKSAWGWGTLPHSAADAIVHNDQLFSAYAAHAYSGVGAGDMFGLVRYALPSHWKTYLAVGAVAVGATLILGFFAGGRRKPQPVRRVVRVFRGA